MSAKFLSLIAGVSALALAGAVQAAEPAHVAAPVQLSAAQMDTVTAAGKKNDHKRYWRNKYKKYTCKNRCAPPAPPAPSSDAAASADAKADASGPATGYDVVAATKTKTDAAVTASGATASAKSSSISSVAKK